MIDKINSLIDTARQSPSCQKHAAALIKCRKIIPYTVVYNERSNHAEERCLSRFLHKGKYKGKYDLIVIRVAATGRLTMSKPCVNCVQAITSCSFIHRIYYSDGSGTIIRVNKQNLSSFFVSSLNRNLF